ncbi:MAG: hypothetical protein WD965_10165, partial [Actinomycetota bacterium]
MNAEIWTYRDSILPDARNLEGFDVEAKDGKIGKVDEATEEIGGSAIVVDTGPWIFGRKVVIPAGTIERVDVENAKVYVGMTAKVYVGMTKDQIKNSPEFDPDRGWKDEEYRGRLGEYYGQRRPANRGDTSEGG